jgi:hypothetical protein
LAGNKSKRKIYDKTIKRIAGIMFDDIVKARNINLGQI